MGGKNKKNSSEKPNELEDVLIEEGANPPDVMRTAETLMQMLKSDSSGLDREAYQKGDRMLSFFQDNNYGESFRDLSKQKIEILKQAIEDLSSRGKILTNSYLGVCFSHNRLSVFICPYGESPEGNVVCKIGIKDVAAFQRWRTGQNPEITPEDIHAAIYRLIVEWSRVA